MNGRVYARGRGVHGRLATGSRATGWAIKDVPVSLGGNTAYAY
ncbi:hypothetical protein [Streptomyces sp. NPDC057686]